MVSTQQQLLILRRVVGPTLFLLTVALIWWQAAVSAIFYISGLKDPWSDWLGPLLPSLCGGFSVLLILRIADNAIGYFCGLAAGLVVLLMPTFLPVHAGSLLGPPLLVIFLLQFAVMLQSPRFSIAYGTVAAVAAVTVSSAAIGLPVAAAIWPLLASAGRPAGEHSPRRSFLALIPLLLILALAWLTGVEWTPEKPAISPGWMARGLLSGLALTGDLLAPGVQQPILRLTMIVSISLLLCWSTVRAWLEVGRTANPGSVLHRIYPAGVLLAVCYVGGLVQRLMWSGGGALPDQAALLPLAALAVLIFSLNVAAIWPRGSRASRAFLLIPAVGWILAMLWLPREGFFPGAP